MGSKFHANSRVTNAESVKFIHDGPDGPETKLLNHDSLTMDDANEADSTIASEIPTTKEGSWNLELSKTGSVSPTVEPVSTTVVVDVQESDPPLKTQGGGEIVIANLNEDTEVIFHGADSYRNGKIDQTDFGGDRVLSNPSLVAGDDLKETVNLSWHNIEVFVDLPKPPLIKRLCNKGGNEKPVQKQVLFGVSGKVDSGTLLAVMGASGAGKTTLMNVLAHQNLGQMHVSGLVKVNKQVIGKQIKSLCAYVQQEDLFIGTLSVKEHLTFQALLRMEGSFTVEEKKARVAEVMSELGLMKCKDTVIGIPGRIRGISGGEMKRLSFASEVITNPALLFVDEPTSGLDSFMAQSVVGALQKMASKGKTILATIHQPSSEVFEMFDSLLLMSEGRVAYMGSTAECLAYFQNLNYPCPANYNPADHYIMTLAIIPGEEERCRERCKMICDSFEEQNSGRKLERGMSATSFSDVKIDRPAYRVGWWTQLRYLLLRSHLSNKREPYVSTIRLMQQIVIALIAGLVYLRQPNGQDAIQNIQGALFFTITTSTFGSLTSSVYVFPAEMPVFLKEHRYGMYRTEVYFIAKTVAELPYYVLGPFLYAVITYFMVGLRENAGAFFIYVAVVLLVNQAALSFGYLISAISPTVQVATGIGPPLVMPFLLFGGFFLADSSIPDYFIWLKYVSWFKYSFEAFNINQWKDFGNIKCDLPVNSSVPCIRSGTVVLEKLGLTDTDIGLDFGLLIAVVVGLRLLALLVMMLRARKR